MDKDKAIGIFDSGLGGLSVLRKLKQELPGEDFIFYGDQKHA
ncbi:MAG: glutamate racemase, partial [Oribacterium parvum]|nr:glutamate racemase [Oribacterium parvum]